jgi:RNA polymerase sigma factor (sigma-70 family)
VPRKTVVPRLAADLLRHLRRLADPPGPDAVLLDRFARQHDESAFAGLVARHGPMVLRVCRRVLTDAHDAEDPFQATFLVLARRAAAIRRPASLAAWLHGVACRVAGKARTAAAWRHHHEVSEPPASPDPHPDPLAQVTAREVLAVLDEELVRLPELYRLPILLCCLEGLSQDEAARQLGWTPGSVRGRLEWGRRRLHRPGARRAVADGPAAPERLAEWWDKLAADAPTAGSAVWALASDPEGTTALLRERPRPEAAPDKTRVGRLIADLDHEEFAVRARAERELEGLGDAVGAEVREALAKAASPEARGRLKRLVEGLDVQVPAGKVLQALRGVEVLEHIGLPEAREVLRDLARGAPGARLTQEAAAALRRPDRQPGRP